MKDIYKYIQECDNILIASPLYFSELTGKLSDVGSRLQTYFCARFFRNEEPVVKAKKEAVILVGGGDIGNHGGGPAKKNLEGILDMNKREDMPELILSSPVDYCFCSFHIT